MKKQFVLVHGAWHGGWCWDGVIEILKKDGFGAIAPTMPGHGNSDDRSGIRLSDYVDCITDTVKGCDGPVILAGHSSAGFIVQSVAARLPDKIEHLVFNNAFILPDGKSQFDLVPPEVAEGMNQAAAASPDNCVPVMADFIRGTLMSNDPEAVQDKLIEKLVPQPISLFTTPVDLSGLDLGRFKKTVIYCKNDASLPPGAYLGMAQALGEFELIELDLDHEGLFTHPDKIALSLIKAAG